MNAIRLDRPAEGVARFTIDNPPRNALSTALREGFLTDLDALEADTSVRCVIASRLPRAPSWPFTSVAFAVATITSLACCSD